jgi:tRNA U34 2-thiouridine synthase MnmA/TrmU
MHIFQRAMRGFPPPLPPGTKRRPLVAVALSGGVDSAVTLYLATLRRDWDVVAVHMTNWDANDEHGGGSRRGGDSGCTARAELQSARDVAAHLGVRLRETGFVREYWCGVFEPFLAAHEAGLTPNADVDCNRVVKFGAFARETLGTGVSIGSGIGSRAGMGSSSSSSSVATVCLGADYLATGHYARCVRPGEPPVALAVAGESPGGAAMGPVSAWPQRAFAVPPGRDAAMLLRGVDRPHDQSYFMCTVGGAALQQVLLPLGELVKDEVRAIARYAGLTSVAEKRSSVGLCFVGKRRSFGDFVEGYLAQVRGPVIDVESLADGGADDGAGTVIGEHLGHARYTIGQGLRLGGQSVPWFVCGKDAATNTIIACRGKHHRALLADSVIVAEPFWVDPEYRGPGRGSRSDTAADPTGSAGLPREVSFKCRYRETDRAGLLAAVRRNGAAGTTRSLDATMATANVRMPLGAVRVTVAPSAPPLWAPTRGQVVALYDGETCLGGGAISDVGASYFKSGTASPAEPAPAGDAFSP